MDPVSVTASAAALVATSANVLHLLYRLHSTIEDAPLLLSSIMNECSIVSTSLRILQDLQTRKLRQMQTDQISGAFETAFTGCALILSVLERDVQSCLRASKSLHDADAIKKCKLILSKDHLQELVMQLRGQQQALTLLMTTLQSRSIDEMNDNIQDNRDILGRLAKQAKRLYLESEQSSAVGESIYASDPSFDMESTATTTRFAFDKEIIASRTYQRTLDYLHRLELRQAEFVIDQDHANPTSKDALHHDSSSNITTRDVQTEHPVQQPMPAIMRKGVAQNVARMPESTASPDGLKQDCPDPVFNNPSFSRPNAFIDAKQTAAVEVAEMPPSLRAPSYLYDDNISDRPTQVSNPSRKMSLTAASFDSSSLRDNRGTLALDDCIRNLWAQPGVRRRWGNMKRKQVVWVGDAACGKTCAIIRGSKGVFPDVKIPTVMEHHLVNTYLHDVRFELRLWDTNGNEGYDSLRPISYEGSDVIVIGFDIGCPDSLYGVKEKWIREVLHFCPDLPYLLVGYQEDLRYEDDQRNNEGLSACALKAVSYEQGLKLSKEIGAVAYVECSARKGYGIYGLFETVTKCCVLGDMMKKSEKRRRNSSFSDIFRWKSRRMSSTSQSSD